MATVTSDNADGHADKIFSAINTLQDASNDLTKHFHDKLDEYKARAAAKTAKFEEEMAALELEYEATQKEIKEKEEAMEEARNSFEDEKIATEGTHNFAKSKVKLNIGGKTFSTFRRTLLSEPDSFLAAMLSGRYELCPDEQDGSYFIDRSGMEFDHIVNFLRGPDSFEVPTDPKVLQVLRDDAIYYRLPSLQKIIDEALNEIEHNKKMNPVGSRSGFASATEAVWDDANTARAYYNSKD